MCWRLLTTMRVITANVLATMQGRAPETLNLPRLRKLLRLCGFFLADALVLGLPAYLDGVVAQLKPPEVRFWRDCVFELLQFAVPLSSVLPVCMRTSSSTAPPCRWQSCWERSSKRCTTAPARLQTTSMCAGGKAARSAPGRGARPGRLPRRTTASTRQLLQPPCRHGGNEQACGHQRLQGRRRCCLLYTSPSPRD